MMASGAIITSYKIQISLPFLSEQVQESEFRCPILEVTLVNVYITMENHHF